MTKRRASSRRRTNDPEGLRRRLIDAAYASFTTRGYHVTSMHDLKHECGVTGGALAHHFPSKKELGLTVLRDRVAAAVEETWVRPVLSANTAADGIRIVFASVVSQLKQRGSVSGCPLNNLALEVSRYDRDFREAIDEIFLRWRDAIAEKLHADQCARVVGGLDPKTFATFVVAVYSGAMAMAKAAQSPEPLKTCAKLLLTMMAAEYSCARSYSKVARLRR